MSVAAEVGQRIRYYRKQKGLSQEALAEHCGFHPTYIGQLERGEKNPSIESIHRITQGLQISMSKFLENIDDMDSEENNVPLELYRRCMELSPQKQQALLDALKCILQIW